jgi:hypothetical protein
MSKIIPFPQKSPRPVDIACDPNYAVFYADEVFHGSVTRSKNSYVAVCPKRGHLGAFASREEAESALRLPFNHLQVTDSRSDF